MGKYIKHLFFRLEELYENSEKIPADVAEINEVEDKLDLYEKEINNVNYALLNRTLNQEYIEKTDRKSTRLNSSHANISYAVFCLKKKNNSRHSLDAVQVFPRYLRS